MWAGITLAGAFWQGFVLMWLWQWFAVPTFDLPELKLAAAMGITLIVSLLTNQHIPRKATELVDFLVYEVRLPMTLLIAGFILSFFI